MVRETLTVQVGQCGNQLGSAFFESLCNVEEFDESPQLYLPSYFRESRSGACCARAVLLDTEPRVISNVVRKYRCQAERQSRHYWEYPVKLDRDEIWKWSGSSGAANNWAFGYFAQAEKMLEPSLELIRKEAEHCDQLRQFMVFQSLAGGTGSGAGSRLTEEIRDAYSSSFLLNAVVWPSSSGEVVVQSYNALLSLAHLVDGASDGNLVQEKISRKLWAGIHFAHLEVVFILNPRSVMPPQRPGSGSLLTFAWYPKADL
mmetsp:Transcript_300/g.600  ORF Transcript_300/g.600 Transcript_300/m.600 type:complete len:259 (-) Transcript_300:923-1699(-)